MDAVDRDLKMVGLEDAGWKETIAKQPSMTFSVITDDWKIRGKEEEEERNEQNKLANKKVY